MGYYDFKWVNKSVVEDGYVYCTNNLGELFKMTVPEMISAAQCSEGVLKALLAYDWSRKR